MTVLERLGQLRTEATPGPWEADDEGRLYFDDGSGLADGIGIAYACEVDAPLIVAAVNALPALLRIARAAERFQENFQPGFSNYDDPMQGDLDKLRSALSDLETNT